MRLLLFILLLSNLIKCQHGMLGVDISNNTAIPRVWTGKTNVFVGNSITYGYGVNKTERWTTRLSAAKGSLETNLGINGQVLQNGTVCNRTIFDRNTIPTKTNNSLYLFIAFGVNDIGMNNGTFTPSGFQSTLTSTIDFAVNSRGWSYSDIVLLTQYYVSGWDAFAGSCGVTTAADSTRVEAYKQATINVAQAKHCILADISGAMAASSNPSSLLLPDNIHPNPTGHQFIADFFTSLNYTPQ